MKAQMVLDEGRNKIIAMISRWIRSVIGRGLPRGFRQYGWPKLIGEELIAVALIDGYTGMASRGWLQLSHSQSKGFIFAEVSGVKAL